MLLYNVPQSIYLRTINQARNLGLVMDADLKFE